MAAIDLVTGAFSYTGRRVAQRLLARGRRLRTLTNHPHGSEIEAFPLAFERTEVLETALGGVDTLYNTYWVRFPHGRITYDLAVENSRRLIDAARAASVRRVVHVSIANASISSPLPYYRGKALVEDYLRGSGLSYAIVRPTVLYGGGDVLVNNIAWFLRNLLVFAVPGSGAYPIQPVYVEDHADLMVRLGSEEGPTEVDAVGPDVYRFDEFVNLIRRAVGSHATVVRLPPRAVLGGLKIVGSVVQDVVLTEQEVQGLMDGLLASRGEPTCPTRFDAWLPKHRDELGHRYASELARHFR
jgi:nucleoside-diphosphate-sugar epimerase